MSHSKAEYIEYRLAKSFQALKDARLLTESDSWSACVNRLYYSCFYIVSALLLKHDISPTTHTGLITQFNLHFIKTGIVEKESGKLYANLMDWRQTGDYGDMFDFTKEKVEPLIEPVQQFIAQIEKLLKESSYPIPISFFKNCPVKLSFTLHSFSGVPLNKMVPPPLPPSGPRSIT